jgi:hypothetical protein
MTGTRFTRKPKTIAIAALALLATLGVGACGGSSTTHARPHSSGTDPTAPTTTTTTPAKVYTATQLRSIDYAALVPTSAAVARQVQPMYQEPFSIDSHIDDLKNYTVRGLCGESGTGSAIGGVMRQYLSQKSDLSVTYTVESFESSNAKQVAAESKITADTCRGYTTNDGKVFNPVRSVQSDVHLDGIGSDPATITVRNNNGLMIADASVRKGQFIYQVRVVSDTATPFTSTPSVMWQFIGDTMKSFVARGPAV